MQVRFNLPSLSVIRFIVFFLTLMKFLSRGYDKNISTLKLDLCSLKIKVAINR